MQVLKYQFAIAIKCFGVSVSYLIICKVSSPRPKTLNPALTILDAPAASLRHLRFDCTQPITGRFDSAIARFLAGDRHDLHRSPVLPEDPRRVTLHQPDRPRNSSIVSSAIRDTVMGHAEANSLILVVVGWFAFKGPSENRGEVVLGRFGKNTLSSFPVQVFAYT